MYKIAITSTRLLSFSYFSVNDIIVASSSELEGTICSVGVGLAATTLVNKSSRSTADAQSSFK